MAKKLGKRVIVVSDIYLPSIFLKEIVKDLNVFDEIYTSCEHGLGKYNNLFDLVIKIEKTEPNKIYHVGDNYFSDVESPAKKGIKSHLLPNGTNSFWSSCNSEFNLASIPSNTYQDYGLTSLRAKSSYYIDISENNLNHFSYGCTILGPIYSSFIEWMNSHCVRKNISHKLYLMREGGFLREVDNLLSENSNTVSENFFISRKTSRNASITDFTFERFEQYIVARKSVTLEQLLNSFGLKNKGDDFIISNDNKNESYEYLDKNGYINDINSICNSLRKRLVKHLSKCLGIDVYDIKENIDLAIIDVGWNGTIQKHLNEIIEIEGLNLKLYGFYLTTTPNVVERNIDNCYGYIYDAGHPLDSFYELIRSVEILEQACASPLGSTIDYNNDGSPVLIENNMSLEQKKQTKDIQKGILRFTKTFKNSKAKNHVTNEHYKTHIRNILFRAMVSPTDEEVQLFLNWQHDENMIENDSENIISKRVLRFLPYMSHHDIANLTLSDCYWLTGTIVHSNIDGNIFNSTNQNLATSISHSVNGKEVKTHTLRKNIFGCSFIKINNDNFSNEFEIHFNEKIHDYNFIFDKELDSIKKHNRTLILKTKENVSELWVGIEINILPPLVIRNTNSISYYIDKVNGDIVSNHQYKLSNNTVIHGWAFYPGLKKPFDKIEVIDLINGDIYPAVRESRPDVGTHFNNENLNKCGFYVNIPNGLKRFSIIATLDRKLYLGDFFQSVS